MGSGRGQKSWVRLNGANLVRDALHEIGNVAVVDAPIGQLLHGIRFLVIVDDAPELKRVLPFRVKEIVSDRDQRLDMPGRCAGWPNAGRPAAWRNRARAIDASQEFVPDALRTAGCTAKGVQWRDEV